MKIAILFITFILLNSGIAQTIESYQLHFEGEVVSIPMIKSENVLINDICHKNLSKCLARKKYISKKKINNLKQNNLGNIAQAYCKKLEGTPLILKDKKYNSIGICAFSDKTMISSWDLYTHAYGGKKKK